MCLDAGRRVTLASRVILVEWKGAACMLEESEILFLVNNELFHICVILVACLRLPRYGRLASIVVHTLKASRYSATFSGRSPQRINNVYSTLWIECTNLANKLFGHFFRRYLIRTSNLSEPALISRSSVLGLVLDLVSGSSRLSPLSKQTLSSLNI